jgi:hypothetical protein
VAKAIKASLPTGEVDAVGHPVLKTIVRHYRAALTAMRACAVKSRLALRALRVHLPIR